MNIVRGLPAAAPGVVLMGGTFDPPTLAHVLLGEEARRTVAPVGSWLVLVPAARSPHKAHGPVASDADRVAMLEAALDDVPEAAIWTIELERPAPSYWVETVRAARRAVRCPLWFVIGADQAVAFGAWREPVAILDLAHPVVLPRGAIRTPADLARAMPGGAGGRPSDWWGTMLLASSVREDSSTRARALLSEGSTGEAELRGLLKPAVLEIARRTYG